MAELVLVDSKVPFEVPEAKPSAATLVLLVENAVNDCFCIPAVRHMTKQLAFCAWHAQQMIPCAIVDTRLQLSGSHRCVCTGKLSMNIARCMNTCPAYLS